MKDIFLHIGAHKTATTAIQIILLRETGIRSRLAEDPVLLSIHNPVHDYGTFRTTYTHLRNRMLVALDRGNPVDPALVSEMARLVQGFVEGLPGRHVVWSDENLLGNTPGHPTGQLVQIQGGLYPASDAISAAFADALAQHSVRVRLYTRDVESLIRSAYGDWISKLREPTPFGEFDVAVRQGNLDWDGVAAPWQQRFGTRFDRVRFETIREGQMQYLMNFAEWAKLAVDDTSRLTAARAANSGLNQRQIDMAKLIMPDMHPEERPALRRFLLQLKPDAP
ncbi:hypothetical protein [Roseicyclus persicicus]|uniref:Sulfotransferase family protein n=1 Tax=Roseicyclus persicicus TaxID=2650661 RepID=A0A7X6JZR9_9RHOB|nr:hypothetical protein [Roseibacterium persicicum]NKX45445.1 hypothetical protein [Roseibacterium persicicum]